MEWLSDSLSILSGGLESFWHGLALLADSDFWLGLLHKYKYWIVILGALVEGEMVLLLAGGAAYHGYMNVHMVMLISFLGALIHDHLLFFIGRSFGKKILNRSPSWHARILKVSHLIHKYDNLFIMSFRFVYGLRTITPLIVGNSRIPWKRYTVLVSISAAIWAIVVAYLGFTFAMALEIILADFDRYKTYLGIGVGLLIAGVIGILTYRNYRTEKKKKS
ncbi:DedA family protein [Alphaproteobacteria bacterium]|nr:DedA family protein [Alphaproteobacteria bacterium]